MSIELLNRIAGAYDSDTRKALIKEYMDGEVKLTDIYAHYGRGGSFVMQALDVENEVLQKRGNARQFYLKVLCDVKGNPVKPGEMCREKWDLSIKDKEGKYTSTRELNADKISGDYDEKWTETISLEIDEKGCIRLPLSMALQYLVSAGVHWKSGKGICRTAVAKASEAVTDSETGEKYVPHYWRYQEVPPSVYAGLPSLVEEAKPEPAPEKATRRKKVEIEGDSNDSKETEI